MRAPCFRPSSPAASTTAFATGSSPRPGNPSRAAGAPVRASIAEFAGDSDAGFVPRRAGSRRVSSAAPELPEQTPLLSWSRRRTGSGTAVPWRAARRLRIPNATIAPATQDGLLDVRAKVRFRGQLVRSAVDRSASEAAPERARSVGGSDRRSSRTGPPCLESRARAQGPQEKVAEELERSAAAQGGRGSPRRRRPGPRSRPDPSIGPPRRKAARRSTGQPASRRVRAALALIEARSPPAGSARTGTPRSAAGSLAFRHDRGARVRPLRRREVEPLDASSSRDTYLDAWSAALFTGGSQPLEVC